ncbi:TetR/AcrR family transcriptional regulator [Alicyclobacillus curvatus]|nr:TetR/AcrR family transcriptional regulator [Alicyclobacillus curvatus]
MSIEIASTVKDPERIRERREQIVKASVQLFAQKGFHKATTREIARASGLSNGALYEYVQSKEDILYLVCQHIHQEIHERLADSLSSHDVAIERLRHAVASFLSVIRDMEDEVLLIYQESKSLPSDYLRAVLQNEQAITDIFVRLLQDGRQDESVQLTEEDIPLVAHDVIVLGQLWAFRRWALRDMDFSEFVSQQTEMILRACRP